MYALIRSKSLFVRVSIRVGFLTGTWTSTISSDAVLTPIDPTKLLYHAKETFVLYDRYHPDGIAANHLAFSMFSPPFFIEFFFAFILFVNETLAFVRFRCDFRSQWMKRVRIPPNACNLQSNSPLQSRP